MSDAVEAIRNDLKEAKTLCEKELATDEISVVVLVARLIGDEYRQPRRRTRVESSQQRVSDPVEKARRNPRRPALPTSAIATGNATKAPTKTKVKAPTKPVKTAAKIARARKKS